MDKLKPGQKFCKECNAVNPIRSFQCKNCKITFTQKQNTLNSKNASIDSFLTVNKSKNEGENLSKENKILSFKIKNALNLIEGISVKNYTKEFKFIDQNFIDLNFNLDSNGKITFNLSTHFNVINGFAFDFTKIEDLILANIVCYNEKLKCSILYAFTLKFIDNKVSIVNKHLKALSNNNYKNCSSRYTIKFLLGTGLFSLSDDNQIYIYYFSPLKGIALIYSLDLFDKINNTDMTLTYDDRLLVLASDNNYKIYVSQVKFNSNNDNNDYDNNDNSDKLKLVSIYEKQFSAKISDLQFLKIKTSKNESLFCASSLDGTLKIFTTLDVNKAVFIYKTSEIWITKFNFSSKNKLLIIMVNSAEKLIGIKFNSDKEPLIKRIPKTDNTNSMFYNELNDTLYFVDLNNKISYVNINSIIHLYKSYKASDKRDFNIETTDSLSEQLICKFKMFNLEDNKLCLIKANFDSLQISII